MERAKGHAMKHDTLGYDKLTTFILFDAALYSPPPR
jgi:hypothetical protein